ncbi:hypothetical protein BGZ70_010420 [Mortierella alpina]|uniref:Endoplasmic oxidoreductin-1 n=1 Tax=Mortierella alpina TaxID=64518 RepID=A0A9P6M5I5_MORAP|nr:hypothetical protein BGZ70_010420 [Mortierella alpina]
MQIENSLCDYDAVEDVNLDMRRQLHGLVRQKYFKFYKLHLYGSCPYWTENHLCTNKDCGVAVIDESFQPFKSCQLKDQDFCQVDDEAHSEGVYVDLMENPERFTGYSGPSAAKVWDAIYNENCFNVAQQMQLASDCEQCSLDREADAEALVEKLESAARIGISLAQKPVGAAAAVAADQQQQQHQHQQQQSLRSESSSSGRMSSIPRNSLMASGIQDEEICLEKRVFYRMISGLHASISIHICDEYFNQTTGVWGPNLDCFVSRVGAHPDRLENIYFDYAMLVRAVTKLSGYLKNYEFCTGNPEEDAQVKSMVDRLIETASKSPAHFDEKAMFVGPGAQALKQEFRDHFRNITKIMDCVGCEKCRLWGKVQTSGLGTALKVLFSYNDEHLNPVKNPNLLQRTEIVALFNTLNRFSESVESIGRFRTLYMEQHRPSTPLAPKQQHQQKQQQQQQQQRQQQQPIAPGPGLSSSNGANTKRVSQEGSAVVPDVAAVLKETSVNTESSTTTTTAATAGTKRPWTEWTQVGWARVQALVSETLIRLYRQPMRVFFYGEERQVTASPSATTTTTATTKQSKMSSWGQERITNKNREGSLFRILPRTMALKVRSKFMQTNKEED